MAPVSNEATDAFPVVFRAGGHPDVDARADQANLKGLFIHTEQVHPVDTLLTLTIAVPSADRSLRFTARVVYSNPPRPFQRSALPPGMGVKYVDAPERDLKVLEELLATVGSPAHAGVLKVSEPRRPGSAPRSLPAQSGTDALEAAGAAAVEAASGEPTRSPAPTGLAGLWARFFGGRGGAATKSERKAKGKATGGAKGTPARKGAAPRRKG